MLTIAFIFATQGCDPVKDFAVIHSENITVQVVGVSSYSQAVEVARNLKEEGYMAIELCPAFGSKGVAHVKEAVGGDLPVGVVRFDTIPALGCQSGDNLFDDMDSLKSETDEEVVVRKLVNRIMKEIKNS